MRIAKLGFLVALLAGATASAETPTAARESARERTPAAPAQSGAAWDDSHMASRYQETPRNDRPRIVGESGYGALASGSAETQKSVPEGIAFTTQRQWEQGSSFSKRERPSEAAFAPSESTPIFRGSTLRAGAVSSGGRH